MSRHDSLTDAAALAFALLRFEAAAAHPTQEWAPPDAGTLGLDAFRFLPGSRRVHAADVVPFLASLPAPAILAPTTWGGMVVLLLLSELSDERRWSAEHAFDNWRKVLTQTAQDLGLTAASRVVLEFDEEAHVFSFENLCLCMERFAVLVGWNVVPLQYEDPRASARLMLVRSDGAPSWGGSCTVEQK